VSQMHDEPTRVDRRADRLPSGRSRQRPPRARGLAIVAVIAILGVVVSEYSAASDHLPPRLKLSVAGVTSERYDLQGFWWVEAPNGCSPIAIDAAPTPAPRKAIPGGRHPMVLLLRTTARPEHVGVEVARPGGVRSRKVRLRPVKNSQGTIRAWAARFRTRVRGRFDVFASAHWPDADGCGTEYIDARFGLRAR